MGGYIGGNQEEVMSAGKFVRYNVRSRRKCRNKGKASAEKQGGIGKTLERYAGDRAKE